MDKIEHQFKKIAVVGCGAVGSFYGSKIAKSGMNVHFLIRNDFETVKDKGLNIQSIDGNYSIHPNIYRNPQEIGNCDLVLIALKSTANDNFSNLLTGEILTSILFVFIDICFKFSYELKKDSVEILHVS